MDERDAMTQRFEEERGRLRAVAYRMLGSVSEAEDALQEAWLRAGRAGTGDVANLGAWLTTVVARVCLNTLRSRQRRDEQPLDGRVPDPIISPESGLDPEHEAVLADSVGLALQVVLETLSPAERLAFVLHDLFAVPFEEIAPLLDRSPAAVRQLASRARRRVRGQAPAPDPDPARQRAVVNAFFAAARDGDFDGLVSVLDPEVVLRSDGGVARDRHTVVLRGARTVAGEAVTFGRLSPFARPVLVNGTAGVVVVAKGRALSVMAFTVTDGRIASIDVIADPARLERLVPPPHGPAIDAWMR
ncbi:sigma-70 family RNA polymerase sigma factor [Nonomuraea sp. MCN248]|uniref:Sigma-70 family RNA polymerase sigma factor n=1 Tax=Nonomuraea corallina TaxID=2989783 RepID=A0ABT4S921_9ACTN|nr:sigma-70 family RNA polymerase sigma factor [Nonomuraea corallina]MDA0633681.1 sigma-70 family RNA polymerase sigma factor [Nonomuraea corallina]